ncbi:MAG: LuxR family transcriptional regulator, maltose regulon positive regulatory protein [Pseudonocardiales bacterium]|nr:LuxR family transcriptional regulator, maltose regulon positive regulatory protein [Pseudonocardiales bacterium]
MRARYTFVMSREGGQGLTPPDDGFRTANASVARRMTVGVVERPVLFHRLAAARITLISAPTGSGKTLLLRSWLVAAGLTERAGWVSVPREERDAQRFWIALLDALRTTTAGAALIGPLTAAPGLNGGTILERLLADLAALDEPLWLVIDDLHELPAEALRQLTLLLLRAPEQLRFVLTTRRDLRLGLHRLRVAGELTELRAADLCFTLDEARALLRSAGVGLSESALGGLVERTEGWAAGLRLAALELAGHPDPERAAAEFVGSERTVAEYLLAEVLDRQPEPVRRLLLRTSILDRVNGPLADLLTGESGGERILQELEEANAFVVSLDTRRTWFRYHHLFADMLQLQFRRTSPGEVAALHAAAAEWYAQHGHPVEAIRHAQAVEDWDLAARLLGDHWSGLYFDAKAATAHELLAAFPAGVVAADPELAVVAVVDELVRGSLEKAEWYLGLASRNAGSVPADRRERFQVRLARVRLVLARRHGDLPAVVEEARRLLDPAEGASSARADFGEEWMAVALDQLGVAETWAGRFHDAERHLEQSVAMGRRIGRPYLEVSGLAHGAVVAATSSSALATQRSGRAIELARRHGWSDEPIAGVACAALGRTCVAQGRLDEAARWLGQAERVLHPESDPAAGVMLHHGRGLLEMARGRDQEALAAFRAADRLAGQLVRPHRFAAQTRGLVLHTLVRLGATDRVEQMFAEMDQRERDTAEMRTALAALRLGQHDPQAATNALAPVLAGPAATHPEWSVRGCLLEAIARDALGDVPAAERALERALDLAEPDGLLWPFLVQREARELLERHPGHHSTHAALIAEIRNVLGGGGPAASLGHPEPLRSPLSTSETRILRYLPTNLTAPEIADQLHLSVHTVKTHIRHLYDKLGTHRRGEAVERARTLGLLAPSPRRR